MRAFSSSMHLARNAVAALSVCVLACAPASTTTTPPPATTQSSTSWTELRVTWDFGPCPSDGRSCHQSITVSPSGGYVTSETPNAAPGTPAEPARRFAALDADENRELHRIVDAPAFVGKVGTFGCPPEYDATIRVELDGPWGTRHDDIGGCVHSSDGAPNGPRDLVAILARHRFATRDDPQTRPLVPTGIGDSCTVGVGCANSLVCVVHPCVVAPCVSGSCQKKQ